MTQAEIENAHINYHIHPIENGFLITVTLDSQRGNMQKEWHATSVVETTKLLNELMYHGCNLFTD